MDAGFKTTWNRGKHADGDKDGYTIEGLRYQDPKDTRRFGWHIWSRRTPGRSHYFWVFERTFYPVQIRPDEFRAGLDPVDLGDRILSDSGRLVAPGEHTKTEMDAVLAVIDQWEAAGDVAPAI